MDVLALPSQQLFLSGSSREMDSCYRENEIALSLDSIQQKTSQTIFESMNDIYCNNSIQFAKKYYKKRNLEQLISKDLSITFKLTESYISYWVMWDQIDVYLHYANDVTDHQPCWMNPISLSFLSDNGYEMVKFLFQEITPTNLGELSLSYAATLAQYNTFTLSLKYNRFDIIY